MINKRLTRRPRDRASGSFIRHGSGGVTIGSTLVSSLRSLRPWHRSTDSRRASIRDLSQSVSPRGSRDWGPAGSQNGQRPHSSPTTSNCPASSRAMAGTDSNKDAPSNKEAAPGSIGEPQVGFTTSLLRKCRWLERIAGSNVASPAKGSRHGKLSSFHLVEQRLHAGGERHAAAAAIGGPALIFRGNPVRHTNPVRHHESDSSPRIRFVT